MPLEMKAAPLSAGGCKSTENFKYWGRYNVKQREVIGYQLEFGKITLLTFRLNAPVVIRVKVKEVRNNIAIYSHALPRIHVIGGQRSVRIAPPCLLITVVGTSSPWLLNRCDEEAWRDEQSSPTFDLQ